MVRKKQSSPTPNKDKPSSPTNMNTEASKCSQCDLVVNRKGENRPGIICRDCRREQCNSCAKLTVDFCLMMKKAGKQLWQCSPCETKDNDIKSVLVSIRDEMKILKQGQEEQQAEREQVIKGLAMVESVAKRVEAVESAQANLETIVGDHGTSLNQQDCRLKESDARITALEDKVKMFDSDAINIRQVNAAVRELREVEKRGRNFIIYNVPESKAETSEERKTYDEGKVKEILVDLKVTEIQPKNVIRVGLKGAKYPRMILVILGTTAECEKVIKSGEAVKLKEDVSIGRDRTYNQRMEARQFRLDKEKEEKDGASEAPSTRGRGRGRAPRNQGSIRGRGARKISTKRRRSQSEEGSKRRRTGDSATQPPASNQDMDTETPSKKNSEENTGAVPPSDIQQRPGTPRPPSKPELMSANGHQAPMNSNF